MKTSQTQLAVLAVLLSSVVLASPPVKRSPGKPQAAVTITTDLKGPVRGDLDQAVRIRIDAAGSCDQLSTQLHGVDGVTVRGGEAQQHGAVSAGAHAERAVFARVPAGVRGLLVVTVRCTANGQERVKVQPFAVEANGLNGEKPQAKVETLGELKTDADGVAIEVMRSTPRE